MIAASLANSIPVITRFLPRPVDVLEPVRYAPARQSAQPFERERRTRSVSRQALAPEIVAGFDADASMHVEPITFDGECGLVGALFRGPVPVVLRAVAWQRRKTLPRPMAMAAHASSAVWAGSSFERASRGESSM